MSEHWPAIELLTTWKWYPGMQDQSEWVVLGPDEDGVLLWFTTDGQTVRMDDPLYRDCSWPPDFEHVLTRAALLPMVREAYGDDELYVMSLSPNVDIELGEAWVLCTPAGGVIVRGSTELQCLERALRRASQNPA